MTEPSTEVPARTVAEITKAIPNYVRPKLNRPEIRQRLEGAIPLFDFQAFGEWRLALKGFRVEPGKKKTPYYMATVLILASDNTAWPAGRMANFWFPIGRTGTPTDQYQGDRDEKKLTAFILAVYRIGPGTPFDVEQGLDDLLAQGKVESDALQFGFRRVPDPYEQEIKDPTNGEILRTVERTGAKEFFDPIHVPAA